MMELLTKFVDAVCRIAAALEAKSNHGCISQIIEDPEPKTQEECPEQTGPIGNPKSYKQMVAEKGLPFLKDMCTARGLAFKPQARENTIIALLETDDARNPVTYGKVTDKTVETPGPFDAPPEEIVDNDPLGLNQSEEPLVTAESVREVLTTIIKMPDGGKDVVIKLLQDGAGVDVFSDMDTNDQNKLNAVNTLAQEFLR
jgi:hypothetical protein